MVHGSATSVSLPLGTAAVHVHAVVRLDGPNGPDDDPPAWGTAELLTTAVRASARRVLVHTSYSSAVGELALPWGPQVDARTLHANGDGPDDDAVAAYVAKHVTNGASETGAGSDHPLSTCADIESVPVSAHVRTLMRTCYRLGGLPEYEPLRLRAWTHTLGYRGHILTKSRAYSTTYAALRAERAHHMGHTNQPKTLTDRNWRYVGSGHSPGAALIAAGILEDLAINRELSREAFSSGGAADG